MSWGGFVFLAVGVLFSFFYGWFARRIWLWPQEEGKERPKLARSWHLHQIWINFLGSLIGWVAAYYVLFLRIGPSGEIKDPNWFDAFVVLLAIVGMMGFLPNAASKLSPKPKP